jgi:hypothetical protein
MLSFNHTLKIMKDFKNFKLVTQEIKPHKFVVIIYKAHIIILPSN